MYDDFLKILLDFQLKQHERFLSKFRQAFRAIDTEGKGLLTAVEFRRLAVELAPTKPADDVEALVTRVDPHRHDKISFSECVSALSADIADGTAD